MPDMLMWKMSNGHFIHIDKYQPHINGGQAMELIEKFNIAASPYYGKWKAWPVELGANGIQEGESAKIAICRAVVASVFGEFVEVEE